MGFFKTYKKNQKLTLSINKKKYEKKILKSTMMENRVVHNVVEQFHAIFLY